MVRFRGYWYRGGIVFFISLLVFLVSIGPSFAAKREIVIVLKSGNSLRTEMYTKMAAAFEAVHPDAKVTFINGREDKVLTMIAGGAPPNIYHSGGLSTEWAAKGMLFSIDHFLKADKINLEDHFANPAAQASGYRNSTYAIPANINTEVLYYNKDMFAQAGLAEPAQVWNDSRWTWDTFRTAAKRLTRDTNGDGIPEVMGYEFKPESSMIYSMIFGGQWVLPDPLRYTADTPEIERGIRYWDELMRIDGSIADPTRYKNYVFDNGTAAMRWYNTGNINTYKSLPFNWEVASLPMGGRPQQFTNRFVFVHGAPNQDLAYEFTKFIQMDVEWSSAFADAWGGVPPLKKALLPFFKARQYSPRQTSVLTGALDIMFSPSNGISGFTDIDTAVKDALQRVMAGEVPLGTAMIEARQKIESIMNTYAGL